MNTEKSRLTNNGLSSPLRHWPCKLCELEFTSFNAFGCHINIHRLRGHKLKYLVLVTKRYNCKICNKKVSIYLSSVWSYASSQGFPTQLQPLPATIRYASTTLNLLHGHNSNL
ncbi:unnamed protein product [Prunus armeniaca]